MKAYSLDVNENGSPKGLSVETTVRNIEEVDLLVEEFEGVIAPKLATNHNQTLVDDDQEIQLEVEELECLIAPRLASNHNETLVSDPE